MPILHRLVFLPADAGTVGGWGAHLANFGKRHDVVPIDLPGAGLKAGQRPLENMAEAASYCEGYLSALEIEHPVLMGYFMGGLLAQALAARNPKAYKGLVLVATGTRIEVRRLMDWVRLNREADAEGLGRADVARAYVKAANDFDARDLVPLITVPTLVLHGDEDLTCPLASGEWLHANIAGSELRVFKGAGHTLPADHPKEIEEAIEGFLAKLA